MIDAGLLGLEDNVTNHLPYFRPQWEGKPATIRIRHLLTHTSGLSYEPARLAEVGATGGMSGPIHPIQENIRRIGQMRLKFAPGEGWEYGVSIDVLACVLATINKSSVDQAIQRYVTGPLGMNDTRFGVSDVSRLAVPYANRAEGEPLRMGDTTQGLNPDGTAGPVFSPSRIFNPLAPQSGGSGMASSGPDFMTLIDTIRAGGGSILKRGTVTAALSNQVGTLPRPNPKDAGKRFGFLGGVLEEPAVAGSPAPKGTVDWGGVYGHNWFIDPVNEISVVSMSNTALEGCNGPYREEIRDAVYGPA
jgi:CubicO group peptidase (beta-lactamase class C family)